MVQRAVLYFSNAASVVGHEADVAIPHDCHDLDYELELACVIGRPARDLPADDRSLECVAGFTIMNDWMARYLQCLEMAVGLGPRKGKDFATSLGPELVDLNELADCYRGGRFHLRMIASVNGRLLSRGDSGSMYWTWPQLLAHASRDTVLRPGDVLGSGTVGTGCILELTPRPSAAGSSPAMSSSSPSSGWEFCGIGSSLTPEPTEPGRENVMPPYLRLGSVPRKRHIAHTHQPGFQGEGIYYEEVVMVAGFSRAYSLVYHLCPPTRVIRVEPAGSLTVDLVDQRPCAPHLKTKSIPRRVTLSPDGSCCLPMRGLAGPLPPRSTPE